MPNTHNYDLWDFDGVLAVQPSKSEENSGISYDVENPIAFSILRYFASEGHHFYLFSNMDPNVLIKEQQLENSSKKNAATRKAIVRKLKKITYYSGAIVPQEIFALNSEEKIGKGYDEFYEIIYKTLSDQKINLSIDEKNYTKNLENLQKSESYIYAKLVDAFYCAASQFYKQLIKPAHEKTILTPASVCDLLKQIAASLPAIDPKESLKFLGQLMSNLKLSVESLLQQSGTLSTIIEEILTNVLDNQSIPKKNHDYLIAILNLYKIYILNLKNYYESKINQNLDSEEKFQKNLLSDFENYINNNSGLIVIENLGHFFYALKQNSHPVDKKIEKLDMFFYLLYKAITFAQPHDIINLRFADDKYECLEGAICGLEFLKDKAAQKKLIISLETFQVMLDRSFRLYSVNKSASGEIEDITDKNAFEKLNLLEKPLTNALGHHLVSGSVLPGKIKYLTMEINEEKNPQKRIKEINKAIKEAKKQYDFTALIAEPKGIFKIIATEISDYYMKVTVGASSKSKSKVDEKTVEQAFVEIWEQKSSNFPEHTPEISFLDFYYHIYLGKKGTNQIRSLKQQAVYKNMVLKYSFHHTNQELIIEGIFVKNQETFKQAVEEIEKTALKRTREKHDFQDAKDHETTLQNFSSDEEKPMSLTEITQHRNNLIDLPSSNTETNPLTFSPKKIATKIDEGIDIFRINVKTLNTPNSFPKLCLIILKEHYQDFNADKLELQLSKLKTELHEIKKFYIYARQLSRPENRVANWQLNHHAIIDHYHAFTNNFLSWIIAIADRKKLDKKTSEKIRDLKSELLKISVELRMSVKEFTNNIRSKNIVHSDSFRKKVVETPIKKEIDFDILNTNLKLYKISNTEVQLININLQKENFESQIHQLINARSRAEALDYIKNGSKQEEDGLEDELLKLKNFIGDPENGLYPTLEELLKTKLADRAENEIIEIMRCVKDIILLIYDDKKFRQQYKENKIFKLDKMIREAISHYEPLINHLKKISNDPEIILEEIICSINVKSGLSTYLSQRKQSGESIEQKLQLIENRKFDRSLIQPDSFVDSNTNTSPRKFFGKIKKLRKTHIKKLSENEIKTHILNLKNIISSVDVINSLKERLRGKSLQEAEIDSIVTYIKKALLFNFSQKSMIDYFSRYTSKEDLTFGILHNHVYFAKDMKSNEWESIIKETVVPYFIEKVANIIISPPKLMKKKNSANFFNRIKIGSSNFKDTPWYTAIADAIAANQSILNQTNNQFDLIHDFFPEIIECKIPFKGADYDNFINDFSEKYGLGKLQVETLKQTLISSLLLYQSTFVIDVLRLIFENFDLKEPDPYFAFKLTKNESFLIFGNKDYDYSDTLVPLFKEINNKFNAEYKKLYQARKNYATWDLPTKEYAGRLEKYSKDDNNDIVSAYKQYITYPNNFPLQESRIGRTNMNRLGFENGATMIVGQGPQTDTQLTAFLTELFFSETFTIKKENLPHSVDLLIAVGLPEEGCRIKFLQYFADFEELEDCLTHEQIALLDSKKMAPKDFFQHKINLNQNVLETLNQAESIQFYECIYQLKKVTEVKKSIKTIMHLQDWKDFDSEQMFNEGDLMIFALLAQYCAKNTDNIIAAHCNAGLNRSPTTLIILQLFMRLSQSPNMSFAERISFILYAMAEVTKHRPHAFFQDRFYQGMNFVKQILLVTEQMLRLTQKPEYQWDTLFPANEKVFSL